MKVYRKKKLDCNYSAGYPAGYRISGRKLAGYPANLISGATLKMTFKPSSERIWARFMYADLWIWIRIIWMWIHNTVQIRGGVYICTEIIYVIWKIAEICPFTVYFFPQ